MATPEHLALHDMLVASAPASHLDRTVATLGSTETVDLALMFAFRVTGRRKALAYRHGFSRAQRPRRVGYRIRT